MTSVIILWVFLSAPVTGWTMYESYATVEACKTSEARLVATKTAGRMKLALENSICLPAGVEPR